MCTFSPPGGSPGGCQKCTHLAPPPGGVCNIHIYYIGPKKGPIFGPILGVPAGGPGGGPRAARPGPGKFPEIFPEIFPGPGGPILGVSQEGVPDGPFQGSGDTHSMDIITDTTGDALRMLRAMHRSFIPSIA